MRDHMRQTEKDTIDVVTFLKKQDVDKDSEVCPHESRTVGSFSFQIDRLQQYVKNVKAEHRKNQDDLVCPKRDIHSMMIIII